MIMKKIVYGLLFASLALAGCAPAPASTQAITSAGVAVGLDEGLPPEIVTIKMTGEASGWGLAGEANRVVLTGDGGQTWRDVTPAGVTRVFSAFFLDAQHAWLVETQSGLSGNPTPTADWKVFRTRDGGESWLPSGVPFSQGALQFVDADHGLAVADPSCSSGVCQVTLYRTDDGGQSWTRLEANDPRGGNERPPVGSVRTKSSDWFRLQAPATLWFGGSGTPGSPTVDLFASQDWGRTWAVTHLPLPGYDTGPATSSVISLPAFINAEDGFVESKYRVGGATRMAVYATHDGGVTWTVLPSQVEGVTADTQAVFPTLQDAYVQCGGDLCATHDAGQTWVKISSNLSFSPETDLGLKSLDFIDAQRGWAMVAPGGQPAQLYATRDGGVTWRNLGVNVMH